MKNYLIIGNGIAGTTAAEYIRKHDKEGIVTILTDELLPFYNRVKLIEFIAGELSEQDLILKDKQWYEERNIKLHTNTRVTGADPRQKQIVSADGREFPYDCLLLAIGSHSFVPPIIGHNQDGVFTLRNIVDARKIKKYAEKTNHVVMIGGGLLGLETGNSLRKLGKRVTVVEFFPRLLPRQLDVEGADRLQRMMEGMEFSFRIGTVPKEISGKDTADGVILEGGEILPAQMIIFSAGVRPNMQVARALGLDCDKGVKVDDRLRTSKPDIFAAGDVAEFNGPPYGIWPAGFQQGKIAGANMAGEDQIYEGTPLATTLKVVGIDLAAAGNIDAEGVHEAKVLATEKVYKKIVFNQGKIVGCVLLGDTTEFNKIRTYMAKREDVSGIKDTILSA